MDEEHCSGQVACAHTLKNIKGEFRGEKGEHSEGDDEGRDDE